MESCVDLSKLPNLNRNVHWTGHRVGDILNVKAFHEVVLLENRTSAPADVTLFEVLGSLTNDSRFEKLPEDWDPWPPQPSCRAVVLCEENELFQVAVWKEWARVTSAENHGFFRMPTHEGALELSRTRGEELRALVDRLGVDLVFRPNLKKNRLWREGPVSGVLELGDIAKIIVYQSTTHEPLERDLKKVLTFIQHGRAVEPEQHGINPVQMCAHVPLTSALLVNRSKAYYRIVIRENEAQITSVAGHGYFSVKSDSD